MINVLSVFAGGGIGAVLRYLTGIYFARFTFYSFPWATFFVNVTGSFLIGFFYALCMDKMVISPVMKAALTVGFCGGLTTFSTFSFELFNMLMNGRFLPAFLYIFLSISLCLAAVWLGSNIGKMFG